MKRDPVIIIVVALVVTIMLVFGFQVARRGKSAEGGQGPTSEMQGKPAPEFALQSLEGKTVRLSDFRGKAVIVNFWATWCLPCKIEMPWFADLQKKYGPEGLQVLGIAMDEDASPQELDKFAKDLGVNYPILIGQESVERDYGGVSVLPITLYIDREGKVLERVPGLRGRSEIEDNIKKALGSNGPQPGQ